jgi:hypothetical protein
MYTSEERDRCREWLKSLPGKKVTTRSKVTAVAFQEEICPETGKHHFQGYAQFERGVKFKNVVSLFNFEGKQHHCEAALGSSEHNLNYTSKEESAVPGSKFKSGTFRSIASTIILYFNNIPVLIAYNSAQKTRTED